MFVIKTERPAVEISHNGEVTRFEYDVVVLKVEMDRILAESKQAQPGGPELAKFGEFLTSQGMPSAGPDVALRMWSLVTVQFNQLASSIAEQVNEALKGGA